jgi:hypothetical protein
MKLSELLTDLNNRPQNAHVLVMENDFGQESTFMIESVLMGNEQVMLLHATTMRPFERFPCILFETKSNTIKAHKILIYESVENGGKYQISVDGARLPHAFETEHEAKLFARGCVLGAETGVADRRVDAAKGTAGA